MKISLPVKLGIFVLVLFALVIATCLLWTPVKIRYYTAKLKSDDPKERVAGVEGLLGMGAKGEEVLSGILHTKLMSNSADERIAVVEDLLGMGEKGVEALTGVLSSGKREAEFLAKYWENYNTATSGGEDGSFPLHIAARYNFIDAVRFFIDKGTDVGIRNTYGWRPLHCAVMNGHLNAALLLFEKDADVNAKDNDGKMPLHHAARRGHKNVVMLLLERGADVRGKDNDNRIPLHMAANFGDVETVQLLIEKGSEIEANDIWKQTPLHIAASKGRRKVSEFLLNNGADINARQKFGWTPLHYAARGTEHIVPHTNRGPIVNIDLVSMLISHKANVNAMTKDDETPLDLATDEEVKSLLRSHGGKTGKEIREQGNKKTRKK